MASPAKVDNEEIAPKAETQAQFRDVEELKVLSNPSQASIGLGKIDDIVIDTVNAETEYTAEQFHKLRWKIDLWLLPLMWVRVHPESIQMPRSIFEDVTESWSPFLGLLWNSASRQDGC
jgi:hypothetical protein